jgi:hypothetical protein
MYKCSACGLEDKFVTGLVNINSMGDPKRSYITFCEKCNKYYLYENISTQVGGKPFRRISLTKDEAVELIVKMKCCTDPKDIECRCNVHKFIHNFRINNEHRMIAL